MIALDSIHHENPEISARILGAIYNSAAPTHPLWKRYFDRTEGNIREVIGNTAFEAAFAEGYKMTIDEGLNLALKTVEEM